MQISTRLSAISAACLLAFGAYAAETPSFLWGKFFDANGVTAGDNNTAVLATENSVYWLNTLGSTDAVPELYFGSDLLFTGSGYNAGTSFANNFALTKTSVDGTPEWTIYTNSGDFASGQGNIAIVEDGLIFTAKARHTDGKLDEPICFVDSKGNKFEMGGTVEKRFYTLFIGKANNEGEIEWLRQIYVENGTETNADATFVSDGATIPALAVSNSGKIFVGGAYSSGLQFTRQDNSIFTLEPRNVDADGKVSDGLYLAAFDSNGYFIDALTADGAKLAAEQIMTLKADADNIYFQGLVTAGDEEGTSTFGGKDLACGDAPSPFIGSLNANDLTVNWLTPIIGEKLNNKAGFQNTSLAVYDNNLWLTGQFNGVLKTAAGAELSSTQETLREGFIIKFNAENGDWVAARNSRQDFTGTAATALTGYMCSFQNPEELSKVYIYGYGMNATVGVYIRCYDANTLEADVDNTWTLLTGGGVPTATSFAYVPSNAKGYAAARGNKAFTAIGGSESAAPQSWAVYAAAFSLPEELLSGIGQSVAPEADSFKVAVVNGGLEILATKGGTFNVFDIAGRKVASVNLTANEITTISLPAGLYIAGQSKFIVR